MPILTCNKWNHITVLFIYCDSFAVDFFQRKMFNFQHDPNTVGRWNKPV